MGGEAEGAAAVVDLAEGVEAEGALGEHGRRGRGRPRGEGGADEGGDGGPGLEEVGVVAHLAQLHQDVDHAHEVATLQRLLRLGPVGVGFAIESESCKCQATVLTLTGQVKKMGYICWTAQAWA